MKLLITGANGQVGSEIVKLCVLEKINIIPLDHQQCDIADLNAVENNLKKYKPDIVINAAAYTAVDRAETEPDKAYAVNTQGAANLATVCAKLSIPLIHISTDYIFDGNNVKPYTEKDTAAPNGVYAISKWQGEQAVREICKQHIIVRVSWVFGAHGHNFVKTILRLAQEREELKIVADQFGCPTFAGYIAEVLIHIAKQINPQFHQWGTYHYCDLPETNWYSFAESIVKFARDKYTLRVKNVMPITTAEYPTPVKRPAYSVLNCQKIEKIFGIKQQNWLSGLEDMLFELR
jgi:dTDP-4-dehydrorhamnose reductase